MFVYIIRAPLSIFISLRKGFPESFIPNNQSNHKIYVAKQLESAFPEKCRERQKYSLVPNRRPPPLINFSKFFRPGHSYFNPAAITFWQKFHLTQAFKIYIRFV